MHNLNDYIHIDVVVSDLDGRIPDNDYWELVRIAAEVQERAAFKAAELIRDYETGTTK